MVSSGYGGVRPTTATKQKAAQVKSSVAPSRQSENLKLARTERAAIKIQRAFRLWQKKRLMRMAAEAIQDSERIMLGRQRLDNPVVANIEVASGRMAGGDPSDPMK